MPSDASALPVIPNIVLGRAAQLALEAKNHTAYPNGKLIWVLFLAASLPSAASFQDYTSLQAALTAGAAEPTFTDQSTTNYVRKVVTATDIAVTPNNTTNLQPITIATNPHWDPQTAQNIGAIGLYFDPDNTTGTDSDLVPLFIDACVGTTQTGGTSTPFTYQQASGGFFSAQEA